MTVVLCGWRDKLDSICHLHQGPVLADPTRQIVVIGLAYSENTATYSVVRT